MFYIVCTEKDKWHKYDDRWKANFFEQNALQIHTQSVSNFCDCVTGKLLLSRAQWKPVYCTKKNNYELNTLF